MTFKLTSEHRSCVKISFGLKRLWWRNLVIMHSTMFGKIQTQHIRVNASHQLSSVVEDGCWIGLVLQPRDLFVETWWTVLYTRKILRQIRVQLSSSLSEVRIWVMQQDSDLKHTSKSTFEWPNSKSKRPYPNWVLCMNRYPQWIWKFIK